MDDLFPTIEANLLSAERRQKNGQEMLLITVDHQGKILKYGILGSARIKELLASGRKDEGGKIWLKLDTPKPDQAVTWLV